MNKKECHKKYTFRTIQFSSVGYEFSYTIFRRSWHFNQSQFFIFLIKFKFCALVCACVYVLVYVYLCIYVCVCALLIKMILYKSSEFCALKIFSQYQQQTRQLKLNTELNDSKMQQHQQRNRKKGSK